MNNKTPESLSLFQKRLRKFKKIKRGYYSFLILVIVYFLSFFLPFIMNSKALYIHYEGKTRFPLFASNYINKNFAIGENSRFQNQQANFRKIKKQIEYFPRNKIASLEDFENTFEELPEDLAEKVKLFRDKIEKERGMWVLPQLFSELSSEPVEALKQIQKRLAGFKSHFEALNQATTSETITKNVLERIQKLAGGVSEKDPFKTLDTFRKSAPLFKHLLEIELEQNLAKEVVKAQELLIAMSLSKEIDHRKQKKIDGEEVLKKFIEDFPLFTPIIHQLQKKWETKFPKNMKNRLKRFFQRIPKKEKKALKYLQDSFPDAKVEAKDFGKNFKNLKNIPRIFRALPKDNVDDIIQQLTKDLPGFAGVILVIKQRERDNTPDRVLKNLKMVFESFHENAGNTLKALRKEYPAFEHPFEKKLKEKVSDELGQIQAFIQNLPQDQKKALSEMQQKAPGFKNLFEQVKILYLKEILAQAKKIVEKEPRMSIELLAQKIIKEADNSVWLPLVAYEPNESLLDETEGKPPHRPTAKNLLGTDDRGRDILVRLAYGFNVSITFALVLTFCSFSVGIFTGALFGYFGGRLDFYGMRLVEIWQNIPFLPMVMIVSVLVAPRYNPDAGPLLQESFFLLIMILGAFGWMGMTYYIRAEFLKEKAKDYVSAAISMGVSDWKIMFKHILPNALTPVITFFPFYIVMNISSLVALDFLGFGLPIPTPSWGETMNQGLQDIKNWWLVLFPFTALFSTLVLVTFIGEAIREAFDPKVFSRLR